MLNTLKKLPALGCDLVDGPATAVLLFEETFVHKVGEIDPKLMIPEVS